MGKLRNRICLQCVKVLGLVFIVVCVFSPSAISSRTFSDKYDKEIKAAVAHWWPEYNVWLAWKAQLYQESKLDPDARSPAGAEGIAQFMGPTWNQVTMALGYNGLPRSAAGPAIDAGAWYMMILRRNWSAKRPTLDKHRLAQASYNAGMGNIMAAQSKCNNAVLYQDIIKCLHLVTGSHALETRLYVQRISEWQELMDRK